MINQDKGNAKSTVQAAVGGGGAATSTGILFQQQVGAVIGSWLLGNLPLGKRLNLGQAKPTWIRFETEAPIDDILVGTSDGGFVAFQVKTNVSLSASLDSPFGKTISQFVRHWLACRDGDRSLEWNRPLDVQLDRMILAVSPNTPKSVRESLPEALQLKSQPGGGQLNSSQKQSFCRFESCVQKAWEKETIEAYSPDVIQDLAPLIKVLSLDSEGVDREAAIMTLRGVTQDPNDAPTVFSGLVTICGELMAKRGSVNNPNLRQKLFGHGFRLLSPPNFIPDIDRLTDYSNKTAATLKRFEEIEDADGEPISIVRECQDVILEAAHGGSMLIIGEPGAGKSGVLNSLARNLRENGSDVLEIAVDGQSVETLEGLETTLRLEHGLIETLEAWDGPEPAWLVVDGLDASRGGHGGEVFRTLIEKVIALNGRWKVIASIRMFDLRMGSKFHELFKGTPPIEELTEPEFSSVRHVRVPLWTKKEFAQLLNKAPGLAVVMNKAPQSLLDVASVPFNTRLISDLVKDGLVTEDFSHISSRAELLQLYWKCRIETLGSPAWACILRVVKSMVEARALRVPFKEIIENDAYILDTLERAGVLISVNNRRGIQFRHHLLFDFATARILLDPEELISGRQKFTKTDARGLMLAPALMFILQEVWNSDDSRAAFWSAAANILADRESDPVIRSAVARICAELPDRHEDTVILAKRIVEGKEDAVQVFIHLSGALGIRFKDSPETPLAPWLGFVRDVAPNIAPIHGALRFLLFQLINRVDDHKRCRNIGIGARALLDYAFSLEYPGNLVSLAITLVGDTYESDIAQSRELLERIFTPDRLDNHADTEVPALCKNIDRIARIDPDFGVRIYRETYGFQVNDLRETDMSGSQILPLISNARQDYGMARYYLKKYFVSFLEEHPDHAIKAIVEVVEDYVNRKNIQNFELLDVEFLVNDQFVRLREDQSHIWAHDPESSHYDDARTLINKLLKHLRSADAMVVIRIAKRLVETTNLAVFWSRLFLAAVERQDKLLDFCMPIAMQQKFLTLLDTTKDAVDVVASGYERLTKPKQEAFEVAISQFDFSRFPKEDDARCNFERRLFGKIGVENLATEYARAIVKELGNLKDSENDRPFLIQTTIGTPSPYHWIQGKDRKLPANQKLMDSIDRAKKTLRLDTNADNNYEITLGDSLKEMEALAADIDPEMQNPELIVYAESQISNCICRLLDQKHFPAIDDEVATARFLKLFNVSVSSEGHKLHKDTEANFEELASWGSPAPRVDAAEAAFKLARLRLDLYPVLEATIDNLLRDPHPAVRMNAALHHIRILDIDQAGFWRRFSDRLAVEQNAGVVKHVSSSVLGRTIHMDPERTEQLVLALLRRFEDEPERQSHIRKCMSDLVAILWVKYERQDSHQVLEDWITDVAAYSSEHCEILMNLRMAFIVGLTEESEPGSTGLRQRSQGFAQKIVNAASTGLESYAQTEEPSADQKVIGHNCAHLLDAVYHQLYFAAKSLSNGGTAEDEPGGDELEIFFEEIAGILWSIGNFATPSTIHYLLKLCELMLPVNPARAFDLAMHAIQSGGKQTGYHFESMGADLLVKLVGQFLADHSELFKDENRRSMLIGCLEIFMDAGWPSAQRLLYRLPELIQ